MRGADIIQTSIDNKVINLNVRQAKLGNKESFCILIRENKSSMYRVAKAILNVEEDVEDAINEAILKAYKNIEKLKDESLFKTWLIKIVINESKTLYRKRSREIATESEVFTRIETNDSYRDFTLYNALNSLDDDLRVTTILFYFEDMKYKDIAKLLNIREGTVKSRLSRAKEKLYQILKEDLYE